MRLMSAHDARIDVLRRGIRTGVCPHCDQRAIDSDLLPVDEPRSCEGRCAVFCNLPALVEIIESLDPQAGSGRNAGGQERSLAATIDHAVKALICLRCQAVPAGSHCSNRTNTHCALVQNQPRVVRVLAGQYAAMH
jgi:hypothetical protein